MPNDIKDNTNLRPTYVQKPDIRFATTFLSNKYRDFSVKGESIMDKETGEIFTRRPSDGRVVSFFQNKKYMHELMLELRVLLNNNVTFKYPAETDTNSYYLNTDYDLITINDDNTNNILKNNTTIPNSNDTNFHKLEFKVSTKSNGFFCRLTTRDCDKAVLEWLGVQYNAVCKNYSGTDSAFLAEKNKFKTIEKWEDSNAVINYRVEVTRSNGSLLTFDYSDYVHINEECCVLFPRDFSTENPKSIKVIIKSITYDKIHFMMNHKDALGNSFKNGLQKFVNPDNEANVNYCNIGSFIDTSDDIALLGNEFIVSMIDVPYVHRYMMKMSKLSDSGNIVFSPERPTDEQWRTNGIWAENVRNVYKDGIAIDQDSELDLNAFERYIAKHSSSTPVNFTTNSSDPLNIYLKQV